MIWETVAAVMLMLTTSVLWVLVAVGWGFLTAAISIVSLSYSFLHTKPIEWTDVWRIPIDAAISGGSAAWSIPSSIWHWAKFEHPWWAVAIAVGTIALVSYERRKSDLLSQTVFRLASASDD